MIKHLFLWTLLLSAAPSAVRAVEIEVKVGTAIVNRNLVGQGKVFSVDTPQLAGWSRVRGATEPIEVYHRWRHQGKDESLVELRIRSSYFRAWSYLEPQGKKGSWTLEVLDWNNKVLASTSFELR